MLEDPHFWVTVAFVIVIALSWKKAAKLLTTALDNRAAKIKSELEEARRLREEAEALLAEYQRKQTEYLKEAETILLDARKDVTALRGHAEKELRASLEARTKHAMERIEQEETLAVAEVRNHVVDIALAAARTLVADQLASMSQDELIKLALSDIERKIH